MILRLLRASLVLGLLLAVCVPLPAAAAASTATWMVSARVIASPVSASRIS